MKITVIIPMYNSEQTIIRALKSIMNQTSLQYIHEVIVVNDGSIDRSRAIVEDFARLNPYFPLKVINKDNGGVSSARNVGLQSASGDWIALLDADDEWIENKIEIQVETIFQNPQIEFLGGSIDNAELSILGRKVKTLYKAELSDLCIKVFPQTSTVLFTRRIFDEIGGYDESQRYGEDANYFMKICYMYNYYYLPVRMVVYDGGKPSYGSSGLSSNLREMQNGVMKNIKELRMKHLITSNFYFFLILFNTFKYIRRIIIVKVRYLKSKNVEIQVK